ncbi:MAG: methyltransferase domain-containing protein [bacterium]|nr:methyltransferase domain-containing protein [bacterium]
MKLLFKQNNSSNKGSNRSLKAGMSASDLTTFQNLLHDKTGIVLGDSKRALVESRVTQRLRALNMESFPAYLNFLANDKSGDEMIQLIDVISTNITRFFREADHFDLLQTEMDKWATQGKTRMRIWSAACSTGEEPYTIAMSVDELVKKHRLDFKILATDISTRVLAHAKAGVYEEDRLANIPDNLKNRYFRRQSGSGPTRYAVSEQLKNMMIFHRLNFTVFPYPIKGIFDVIFCRNAMIYFDRDLRTRMVREFARLLRPGGILMIGHAETLIGLENQYRTIKPSVYLRLNDGANG